MEFKQFSIRPVTNSDNPVPDIFTLGFELLGACSQFYL